MTEQATTALPRPHRGLATVVLVIVGVSLTLGALSVNGRRAEHAARLQTEQAVESTATAMGSRFDRTEEIVSALAAFVMSSEDVDRAEFDRFVGGFLGAHPEIRSVQLLDYVNDAERAELEGRLAEVGVSGITELDSQGILVSAPRRDQYLVTWFDAPERQPPGGTGVNILGEPGGADLVRGMVTAGTTGAPVSQLVRGPGGEMDAVRILRPVFDAGLPLTTPADRLTALVGAASAVVSYERVFGEVSSAEARSSNLVISTGDSTGAGDSGGAGESDATADRADGFLAGRVEGELVTPHSAPSDLEPLVAPTAVREVDIGGRNLRLGGSPREGAAVALGAGNREVIVAIGAVLTFMAVAGYLWWSRVRRLERLARALESANEALEANAAEMQKLAERDHLTGLPNRQSVHRMVDEAMRRSGRPRVSVILVDLDRFKEVNDSIGHSRGDELLRMVADRLAGSVRSGTLGRLGGDEFCVLLDEVDHNDAAAVADRLVSILRRPFRMGERSVSLTATAALCSSPSDASTAVELMERVDVALHSQKARARDTWVAFDGAMAAEQERRRSIETELRYALEGNGTTVLTHFQPKVDLLSGRIVSAEGLARWKHPVLGEVSPEEFIDVAEETGLIVGIGEVQIGRAIDLLRRCRGEGLELDSISVNVSAQQFSDERLIEHLRTHLRDAALPADALVLEITESEAMDQGDFGAVRERMEALASMGVGLSIDDFGTGYSSMSRVERLPVNEVKVDQSFVSGLPGRRAAVGITRAIVSMAHTLGMRVVAEGVETEEQRDWLIEEHCDLAQGWLYARAMDAESFVEALRSQQHVPTRVRAVPGAVGSPSRIVPGAAG